MDRSSDSIRHIVYHLFRVSWSTRQRLLFIPSPIRQFFLQFSPFRFSRLWIWQVAQRIIKCSVTLVIIWCSLLRLQVSLFSIYLVWEMKQLIGVDGGTFSLIPFQKKLKEGRECGKSISVSVHLEIELLRRTEAANFNIVTGFSKKEKKYFHLKWDF